LPHLTSELALGVVLPLFAKVNEKGLPQTPLAVGALFPNRGRPSRRGQKSACFGHELGGFGRKFREVRLVRFERNFVFLLDERVRVARWIDELDNTARHSKVETRHQHYHVRPRQNPHKPPFRRHILSGLAREVGEPKKTFPHFAATFVRPHVSGDVVKYLSVKRGAGAVEQTNKSLDLGASDGGARERVNSRDTVNLA
jgi:hypothetical protein